MTDRTLLTRARDALKRGDTRETFYSDSRGDTSGPVIDAIDAFLAQPAAPAVPDGMVLVPREPSDKQISAGNALSWPFPSGPTYRAMIAAAPTPQAVPAPAVPDGMVMAPREPTHEMLYAMAELDGWRKGDRDHPMFTRWRDYWNAALYAAPQAVPAPAVREPQSQEWIVSRNPAPHAAAPMVPSESRTFTFGAEPVVREPLTTDRIAELWVDILLTTPPNGIHEEEGLPWARLARAVEQEHDIGITGGGNG